MIHDPFLLAYLAGAMDADGHITIQRTLRSGGKRYVHRPTYYFPKMGYTSVSLVVPNLLRSTFGGAIHEYQSPKSDRKLIYNWYIGTIQCGCAAAALIPHLRQKAEQARLVVELGKIITDQHADQKRTQKPPYRITPEQLAIREAFWVRMDALNAPNNRRVHFLNRARDGALLDGIEHKAMPA